MRNTTKLKHILQLYTVSLDLEDENAWTLMLTSKMTGSIHGIEGDSYSSVINKAYSHFRRELKKIEA